jgi:archaellum component FlaG (FlaF/FlaG flagellin family)
MIKFSQGLSERLSGSEPDMITNGNFTTDTTGWTATSATLASVAGGQDGNSLQITNSSTVNGKAYQDIATIIGQTYQLSLYAKRGTAATIAFYIGTTGSESSIYTSGNLTVTVWTPYVYSFVATAYTTRITLVNTTTVSGNTGLFDLVTLTQVSGSIADIFAHFYIAVYDSASAYPTQPTTPNDAITDTQLLLFSDNKSGNPLKWNPTLVDGYLTKLGSIIPSSDVVASGTAKYFRLYRYGDNPATASTTLPRIDGTVGDYSSTPAPDLTLLFTNIGAEAVALTRLQLQVPSFCGA